MTDLLPAPVLAAPGLFRITQTLTFGSFRFSANQYAVPGENGFLFDAGFGRKKMTRSLAKRLTGLAARGRRQGQCLDIKRVLVSHSHWDHFSGLKALQEQSGLTVLATPAQSRVMASRRVFCRTFWARSPLLDRQGSRFSRTLSGIRLQLSRALFIRLAGVDFTKGTLQILNPGERLFPKGPDPDAAWQVIPVPGHCDDDIALYNEKRGVLLGGDLVLPGVTTWLGPPRSDLVSYLQSLERVRDLPGLKTVFPAHGRPVTDPVPLINKRLEHRHQRTGQLLEMIRSAGGSGLDFDSLVKAVYPNLPRFKKSLFSGWIAVTLAHLADTGRIRHFSRAGRVFFSVV